MLFYPSGYAKPVRVQGAFVSDDEVAGVVEFLKSNGQSGYDEEAINRINSGVQLNAPQGQASGDDRDEYFADAGRFIIEKEKASIGMLQRYYKIGFNRAARIMDQLSDAGIVGPEEGTKPRKILMSADEFEEYLRQH
jgi:S-DNA-T family DNA segregation ATPase FtsK/SpoIIIE